MKRLFGYIVVTTLLIFGGLFVSGQVELNTFTAGEIIRAADMNENFQNIKTALMNKQTRVSDTCAVGSAIRAINTDGTVECQTSGSGGGGGDITSVTAGDGLSGGGDAGDVALAVTDDIARDTEIMPTVLANDGDGSTLDADTLDGKNSSEFADATHSHDEFSMLPVAMGFINLNGDVFSGTPGLVSTYDEAQERYEIKIPDESYFYNKYVTVVTLSGCTGVSRTSSVAGELLVYVYDLAGAEQKCSFSFVTFKP